MSLTMSQPAVTSSGFPAHREHLRFPVVAEADLTALHSGRHLMATVSELSRCGCYLDTPDAFNTGTEVCLHIRHDGHSCELPGKVIYMHQGWGMGVIFGEAAAGQLAALDEWLVELCRKKLSGVGPRELH